MHYNMEALHVSGYLHRHHTRIDLVRDSSSITVESVIPRVVEHDPWNGENTFTYFQLRLQTSRYISVRRRKVHELEE